MSSKVQKFIVIEFLMKVVQRYRNVAAALLWLPSFIVIIHSHLFLTKDVRVKGASYALFAIQIYYGGLAKV